MTAKITLPIIYEKNTEKKAREVMLPVDDISAEDWYNGGNEKVPNVCRVTVGSLSYKVALSRHDLEKELEALGVKIYKAKAA